MNDGRGRCVLGDTIASRLRRDGRDGRLGGMGRRRGRVEALLLLLLVEATGRRGAGGLGRVAVPAGRPLGRGVVHLVGVVLGRLLLLSVGDALLGDGGVGRVGLGGHLVRGVVAGDGASAWFALEAGAAVAADDDAVDDEGDEEQETESG